MNEDGEVKNNVTAFTLKKGSKAQELVPTESNFDKKHYFDKVVETLKTELDGDVTGVVSIIFDKDENPSFLFAGVSNPYIWIGALESFKNDFLNSLQTYSEDEI